VLTDGTPAVVEHDQSIFNSETRLVGELGVTSWLAIGAVLPFRVFDTHIHYLDPATQQVVQIENPTLHHRNEVLTGIADPWLLGRVATRVHGVTLSARLGTTIPLGSTVPDPFRLGDEGIPHEHTQFGTGTFAPIIGGEAYRSIGGVTLDGYALTVQSLYANGYGYKAGNRYAFGLGAASDLGTARWRFRATLERLSESAESWSGIVYTSEGNIGRTDVLAGIETTYRIDDDWHASLGIKVPLYTHVVGGKLDTPLFAMLTIGTHAHVWKPKQPAFTGDWRGLDERDATTLSPVPGKITVFDFWADWCKPCAVLDGELAAVARRHPDAIAVRKVNVIDDDSAAWKTYLEPGGFNLPHVKLFGRDGRLLWERTGAPPTLAAAVEDAITGAHVEEPAIDPASTRIDITVTDAGYTPSRIAIPRGKPVVLVFTRKSEQTCAVDVHFVLPDGTKIDRRLPLNQPVAIPLQIDRAVEIPFACGMDMDHGTIVVP
jgi:thiol-disulfide isomerase/thioredoxin